MLKKKSLKTILMIFVLITAIGVTSSLFGGSRPGKTSSGSNSKNEEIDLPTVEIFFENYYDWLDMEDPEDTVNCPAFALGDDSGVIADSLFYVKSAYVEVQTDYIWIKDHGYDGIYLSNNEACELVDSIEIGYDTYRLYHITDDVTFTVYISI